MFNKVNEQFEESALHVLDRGYAGAPTIKLMLDAGQDFLRRWKKGHNLTHAKKGTKKTYQLSRSFKAVEQKRIYDK